MVEMCTAPAIEVGFVFGGVGYGGGWGEVVEETGFGCGRGCHDVFEVAGGVVFDVFLC